MILDIFCKRFQTEVCDFMDAGQRRVITWQWSVSHLLTDIMWHSMTPLLCSSQWLSQWCVQWLLMTVNTSHSDSSASHYHTHTHTHTHTHWSPVDVWMHLDESSLTLKEMWLPEDWCTVFDREERCHHGNQHPPNDHFIHWLLFVWVSSASSLPARSR